MIEYVCGRIADPAGAEAPSIGEGGSAPWRFFLHVFYDSKKLLICQAGFWKFLRANEIWLSLIMSDPKSDTIAIQEAYTNLYNEIVKHDRGVVATLTSTSNENRYAKNPAIGFGMDNLLVPEDEALLQDKLARKLSGLHIEPETSQADMLTMLERVVQDNLTNLPLKLSDR